MKTVWPYASRVATTFCALTGWLATIAVALRMANRCFFIALRTKYQFLRALDYCLKASHLLPNPDLGTARVTGL